MSPDIRSQRCIEIHISRVLAAHDDRVDARRTIVLVVADRHLRLTVRAEVVEGSVLALGRQLLAQAVRHRDRQRHELFGVGACVAEHQPLVTGALTIERILAAVGSLFVCVVHSLGDVGGLLADGDADSA